MFKARFVVITTTVTGKPVATRLAREIVGAQLAACVQMWPIFSIYRWKGRLESGSEYALACKTRASLVPALQAFIRSRHAYEVPEIVVSPLLGGSPDYLSWILNETTPSPQPPLTFRRPATKKAASRKGRKR